MDFPSLDSLYTEILLKIFQNLDIYDLCKLKQTCRRFNEIIDSWAHVLVKDAQLLVTNQIHPGIKDRSAKMLSPFEKWRISNNWKSGVYNERGVLYRNIKYIPWSYLEKDLLWLSRGSEIKAYRRNRHGINQKKAVFKSHVRKVDICKFVLNNEVILTCHMDGSICMLCRKTNRVILNLEDCHESDINSVDMSETFIATGSRDDYVKIWRKPDGYGVRDKTGLLEQSICLFDRVWSVALEDQNRSLLAIGTAGTKCVAARVINLSILDINAQKITRNLGTSRYGAGVLDIKWESPQIVWTCGYDSCLRRWDLRTGKCEQRLEDPYGSTVYCMQHDRFNTIFSGMDRNGRVILWDTRQKNYVQMYFMDSCRSMYRSSPIYSLSFDAEFLFAITDQCVNILDFSVQTGKSQDYSNSYFEID